MMLRYVAVGMLFLCCVSCGDLALQHALPTELTARQPRVVAQQPLATEKLLFDGTLTLTFSTPLDPETIGPWSIPVLLVSDADAEADIEQEWRDGLRSAVDVQYDVSADAQTVRVVPAATWESGALMLLVTNALYGHDGVPFAQFPQEPGRAYVLQYALVAEELAAVSLPVAPTDGESAEPDASDEPTPVASVPADMSDNSVPMESETTEDLPPIVETPAVPLPDVLVINEVLYDVPGSDTNGVLFVELAGTPGSSLAGVVVRFLNGDGGKETAAIVLPDNARMPDDGLFVIADGLTGNTGATSVLGADYVANFDPQNGPDAVQVLAPDGVLWDALGYGSPLPLHDSEGLLMYEGLAAPDAVAGSSLSRVPESIDTDANNVDFIVNVVPSPGSDVVQVE